MASFPNNIDHDIYILQGSESDLTQNLMHSADFQESKSQNIIPYPLTQKKSNNNSILQEEKSVNAKNDVSQLENQPSSKSGQRHPIVIHSYKSLFPEIMKKKKKSGYQISGTQLTVYYFNTTKWISFPKNQLNKKFVLDSRSDVVGRQQPLIKYLIPLLVKQYCVEFLNFQPLEVNHQYFQLKISSFTNQDDPLVDPFSHQDQIDWLFSCSNLVLLRRQKDYERLKVWQKKISTDMEALQIIIPFQRQIIQQVQKNKTLGSLKQKILSSNRLGSNIAIVTYGSFIGCDLKKKIGDIVAIDRILQVYRVQSSGFQDVEQNQQRQKIEKNYKQQSILTSKQSHPLMDLQFEVNQSLYSGKLYIQVVGTKIIQKYLGGMVSYITSYQRRIQRSVQTLVGISIQQTTIKMKFLSKSGSEICIYNFQSKSQKQSFFRCINQIGRFLKQNFQKIPQ